jgi:hypothetical protein
MVTVEMPANDHPQPRAAASTPLLGQLEQQASEGHGVVPRDDPLFLVAEDLVEVVPANRHEGAGGIRGGATEGGIVVGDEPLAQVAVRRAQGGDPGDAELVDEATLQRPVGALTTAAGLGRSPFFRLRKSRRRRRSSS